AALGSHERRACSVRSYTGRTNAPRPLPRSGLGQLTAGTRAVGPRNVRLTAGYSAYGVDGRRSHRGTVTGATRVSRQAAGSYTGLEALVVRPQLMTRRSDAEICKRLEQAGIHPLLARLSAGR